MFPSRAATLSLYLPKILYECSRNARKGVTIPLKKIKPVITPKKKETYSEKEYWRVRRDNMGVAHGLMRRVESGYDNDVDADPEEFLDTDIDAFDADYIHRQHRRLAETDMKTRYFHNIKRKHFKEEKLPNMITYIEKQQIRHLHKEDPETWCIDKLAESFPATPAIIKKVLNSQFTAYTVEQVLRHDKAVHRNWDLFRKGKLTLREELNSHYAKFVDRLKFETNVNEIKKFLPPPPDFSDQSIREFSEIIASSNKYQKMRENERKQIEIDERGNIIHESRNIKVKVIEENRKTRLGSTHFTLDKLREELDSRTTKSEIDTVISKRAPQKALPSLQEMEEPIDVSREFDYLKKETGVVDKKLPYNFSDIEEDHVALRIRIPERLWQKDKLYRMKDCFYDDQGVFLYRVPGLF